MAFHFPLDKLAQDPYNVATWHLVLLLPQWCLVLPPHGGATSHRKMWIQLKHFLADNWENLQKFFLWTQTFLASSSSIPFPQHDLPTHKCLLHSLAFGRAGEYFQAAYALAPFSPTCTSFYTTLALTTLHLESNGYFPLFLKDYEPNQDLFSNWCSNACHIYQQVVLLGWFLNTFRIVFIVKIQLMDSFNCSNFVFILHRATIHPKLHVSLEWPTF